MDKAQVFSIANSLAALSWVALAVAPARTWRIVRFAIPGLLAVAYIWYIVPGMRGGEGGFDIYLSKRLDDTWLKWAPPVNIGADVNTPQDEMNLTVDAELERMQDRFLNQLPQAARERRQTVEHPFGTLKAWMGASHFQTRTLPKVRTEMSLQVLAYNMKRVIRLLGTASLIQAIQA